jgi:hypothetical protein
MDTSAVVDDILTHFGAKGMKWGVRKTVDTAIGTKTAGRRPSSYKSKPSKDERRVAKADARLEKTIASRGRQNQLKAQLHNSIGPVVQSKVNQMNAKPEWQKAAREGKLKTDTPEAKKYVKEYNKIYMNEMNNYLKGYTSASGRAVTAEASEGDFLGFKLNLADSPKVKHEDLATFKVEYIKDEQGLITGFEIVFDDMAQSAIDSILEHHGVKGQRWGVRRKATVGAQEVIVSDKRKRLKTSGGRGHPSHPDAVSSRKISQVGKKSGLKALSNKELEDYNRRLNLEQNTKRLMYEDSSPPSKFIKTILRQTGRKSMEDASTESAKLVKKAILAAAAAG